MSSRNDDFLAEVKEMMSQLQPSSVDEANTLLKQLQDRRNFTPLDDFAGLSPAMMHRFLSFPVDSPDLIDYPKIVTDFPEGFRLTHLFELLVTAIGENGIKTTAKGNLPLSVVKSIATQWLTPDEYDELTSYTSIRTESQVRRLHLVRILCEMAGLIRKIHGRFVITKVCLQLKKRSGFGEIYPRLFKAYVTKFNWHYFYEAPTTPFMQSSFAFTLFLLDKFGDDWRPVSFYEGAFLTAFPLLSNTQDWLGLEENLNLIKHTFTHCNIAVFGQFFGFVDVRYDSSRILRHVTDVRKTELLGQLVKFHIPT